MRHSNQLRRGSALTKAVVVLTGVGLVCALLTGGAALLIMYTVSKTSETAREETVRLDLRTNLEPAVYRYRLRNGGEFPESLDQLIEDPALSVKAEALIDPWGRPYQYSPPDSPEPDARCRIWSLGLNPDDATGYIGNW